MECTRAQEFLSFYVYGELSDDERATLDKHLQICGGCTRKLEEYRVVRDALGSVPELRAPPDFLVHVRGRLSRPETLWDQVDDWMSALSPRRMAAATTLAALVGVTTFYGDLRMDHTMAREAMDHHARAERVRAPAREGDDEGLGAPAPAAPSESEDLLQNAAVVAGEPALGSAPEPEPHGRPEGAAPVAPSASRFTAKEAALGDDVPVREREAAPTRDRRSAAESFDAAYGESVRSSLRAAPAKPRKRELAKAKPMSRPVEAPALVELREEASLPDSPFLEAERDASDSFGGDLGAADDLSLGGDGEDRDEAFQLDEPSAEVFAGGGPGFAAAPPRDLSSMDADALSDELGEMMAREGNEAGAAGLSIFAPAGDGDARARLDAAMVASAPAPAPERAPDPEPEPASLGPAEAPPAISLAWLRTRFGGTVTVKSPESEPLGVSVARQLEVHPRRPREFLSGLHDLAMAGLGLSLERVVYWDGIEVEVLVRFGSGDAAEASLRRFVTDLRTLARGEVVSDVSLGTPPGKTVFLRVVVPNPGATLGRDDVAAEASLADY